MMNKLKIITLFFIILLPSKVFALIEVDITRGNLNPLPIAVSLIPHRNNQNFKKELKIDEIGNEISYN